MTFAKDSKHCMIRLMLGEPILETLKDFATQEGIKAGIFYAIGAASDITIAYYDLSEKKYIDKVFSGTWEVVSMTGNIARLNDDIFLHAHAVFSDPEMNCKGGHVKSANAGPTLEVFLTSLSAPMERLPDDAIGLNLLSFS